MKPLLCLLERNRQSHLICTHCFQLKSLFRSNKLSHTYRSKFTARASLHLPCSPVHWEKIVDSTLAATILNLPTSTVASADTPHVFWPVSQQHLRSPEPTGRQRVADVPPLLTVSSLFPGSQQALLYRCGETLFRHLRTTTRVFCLLGACGYVESEWRLGVNVFRSVVRDVFGRIQIFWFLSQAKHNPELPQIPQL